MSTGYPAIPTVSTDPEKAAEIERAVAALRVAREGHRRNSNAYKALSEQITTLNSQTPPMKVSLALTKSYVEYEWREALPKVKAKFAEEFERNPMQALEWSAATVVHAQVSDQYRALCFAEIDKAATVAEIVPILGTFRDSIQREVLRHLAPASGSWFRNAVEAAQVEELADLLRNMELVEHVAKHMSLQASELGEIA